MLQLESDSKNKNKKKETLLLMPNIEFFIFKELCMENL